MVNFTAKLKNLPQKPGVYLFKNHEGEVLYVGKAKNLKNRVRSYFVKMDDGRGPRIDIMKSQIADLDYTVVTSETESLILENNLIKQYQPRYNVSLRDDKNFAFIKIDYDQQIPQIYPVRHLERKAGKAHYFGPYTGSVKSLLKLIGNIFHLCRSKKITAKPCFAYHIGRCPGVCAGLISLTEYRASLRLVEDFLKSRQTELVRQLRADMKTAASERKFEKASILRDKLFSLERLWERQKMVSAKKADQDFLGLFATTKNAVVTTFIVREGKLIHTENFSLDHESSTPEEILEKFLLQYYADASDVPKEIYLPHHIVGAGLVAKTLSQMKNQKVDVSVPTRGKKKGLVRLASENAKLYYAAHEVGEPRPDKSGRELQQVLISLQKILGLPGLPRRIECYDISNIQGTNPVGSMVVFTDGKPDKSQYRKFKINVKDTPDDFAMMKEMLERRFARSQIQNDEQWPLPDLIVIDGGKGQLNVALDVLRQLPTPVSQLPAIGLAKRLEEIFIPKRKQPIILQGNHPALFLLQRLRDEAHRFAITFYRSRHRKQQSYSRLQDIPGIGPVTRKKLIRKFGSVTAVRGASLEALAAEIGMAAAKKVRENL